VNAWTLLRVVTGIIGVILFVVIIIQLNLSDRNIIFNQPREYIIDDVFYFHDPMNLTQPGRAYILERSAVK